MAKRLFDILAGMAALVMLSPIIVFVAVAVMATMGRPVLFRQSRAGLYGRNIVVTKFRSMRVAHDAGGVSLPDAERLTRVGRIIRRLRIDELPEFAQIVSGTMSFVGPRPLPRRILEESGVFEARCRVRPGLTGLAQVSGNTLLDNREKFAIDLFYVDTHTFAGDLWIILRTAWTVVTGERRNDQVIRKALRHANGPDRSGR